MAKALSIAFLVMVLSVVCHSGVTDALETENWDMIFGLYLYALIGSVIASAFTEQFPRLLFWTTFAGSVLLLAAPLQPWGFIVLGVYTVLWILVVPIVLGCRGGGPVPYGSDASD